MRAREFVRESLNADQVLDYVKRTHAPDEFNIEYSITDHPKWELKTIPLSQLNLDPDGEARDPYNRVNWVDDDKVQELIPRIGSVLKSRPIVVDTEGWIIDGNHRAMAAAEAGLTSVPALVPVKQDIAKNQLNEFVPPDSGDSHDYLLQLASAWHFGKYSADDLSQGIRNQQGVETILQHGIICSDGVSRQYRISHTNAAESEVVIYSEDYIKYGKTNRKNQDIDTRTGKPFGPCDVRRFSKQELEDEYDDDDLDENMDHSRDGRAVEELKASLLAKRDQLQSATDDQVYDIIDRIMKRIARSHSISGQKLHDMWVDRYKQIPDTWIMNENLEQKPVIIYTDHKGATIDDGIKNSLRVTQIPVDKLRLWEKHKSMQDPKVADWVTNKLLPELKQNGKLKPLLVWNNNGQFFVIDGNHRLIAYQEAGYRGRVPVQIVPDNMITVSDTVPDQQGVAEGESNDTAISLSKLGKFHPGADTLAQFVPERATAQYALHPDKWESTFYSLTNKDSDKLKYYGPKKISIPPGTLVGDMAIANKFYRAKTPEEKQQYAELYKASLQPYPVDVSEYRMPELLIPKQDMAEDAQLPGDFKLMGQNLFLKNLARNLKQRYPDATVKLSSDRVTAYHNEGDDEALSVMGTEVMDSGYIGVGLDDAFTESFQGVLVPTIKQTTEQLLAANPGTRPALFLSTDNWNPDAWTHIATKLGYRLVADDESLDENFADGRKPGRKGLAKRSGVNTKASVSTLRNVAKHSTGEKQRMAHWLANMKAGRAKAKKK